MRTLLPLSAGGVAVGTCLALSQSPPIGALVGFVIGFSVAMTWREAARDRDEAIAALRRRPAADVPLWRSGAQGWDEA